MASTSRWRSTRSSAFEPESWSRGTSSIGTDARGKVDLKQQKQWLASNFRLTIPGVDTSKVSKIGAFTATQNVIGDQLGEARELQRVPGKLELGNLVVTSAATSNEKFHQWFD